MVEEIKARVEALKQRIRKFRHEIHRNPELSGAERETAAFVAGVLEDNDIDVCTGVGGHGVVGLIEGARPGPTIALRADMDALPIQEAARPEYCSVVPGVMHACGHDVHTAVLMGAAVVLGGLRERLDGSVKLIFQPSEEKGLAGASTMIRDGVLSDPRPSAIVALHCYPEVEAGVIAHRSGYMTASADKFRLVVKGRSGHASRPHQTVDAVLIASLVINAIHHIVSRRTDPLHHAVISIGTIRGGSAANIVAEEVEMEGTVRTLDDATRDMIPRLIEETVKGVTRGMDGGYELHYIRGTPPVINDPAVDALVSAAAADIVGEENVVEMAEPLMGAEDFAYYAAEIPGSLFRLGTCNRKKGITAPLHSSAFDVDEDALVVGAAVMSWIAARYLSDAATR